MFKSYVKFLTINLIFSAFIYADVGGTISIQGILRSPDGTTVTDGFYSISVSLYENQSGGSAVYTEVIGSAEVQNGVFNIELGATTASSAALDDVPFNTTYYVGLTVSDGYEMTPRTKLTVSPYSMAMFGSSNIIPNTGNVGLGTLDPQAVVHIIDAENNSGEDLLLIEDNSRADQLRVEDDGTTTIPNGGSLGIGTATPIAALDIIPNTTGQLALSIKNPDDEQAFYVENDGDMYINKNIYLYGDTTIGEGRIVFSDGNALMTPNKSLSSYGISNAGAAIINADASNNGSGNVVFQIDGETKLAVGNNGHVGIGDNITSSLPFENTLEVEGSVGIDGTLDMNSSQIDNLKAAAADDHVVNFGQIYPVGSIYINATSNTNPGTLLGIGTWVALGAGKVLVGYDASDSDFNSAMETGGSKTHTLATTNMPSHTHSVDPPNTGVSVGVNSGGSHTHAYTAPGGVAVDAGGDTSDGINNSTGGSGGATTGASAGHTHGASGSVDIASFDSGSTGSGSSISNLQPYITVYMWYRTN